MGIVAFKRKHCCFFNIFWILCTFSIILNLLPIYKITISSVFSNKKYALCGVFSFFDIIKKNLCEGEVWSPKFCMTKNAATIWDPVHSLTSAASPFPALSLPSRALNSIRGGKGWTPRKFLTSLPASGQSTTRLKLATAS